VSAAIVLLLGTRTGALLTLFTASTLIPAILYAATSLPRWRRSRRTRGDDAGFARLRC
jgi:hypothetical protein